MEIKTNRTLLYFPGKSLCTWFWRIDTLTTEISRKTQSLAARMSDISHKRLYVNQCAMHPCFLEIQENVVVCWFSFVTRVFYQIKCCRAYWVTLTPSKTWTVLVVWLAYDCVVNLDHHWSSSSLPCHLHGDRVRCLPSQTRQTNRKNLHRVQGIR